MSDCIFCKIAEGEIPSKTVYEDDQFRVILDINPANEGHCLVIPKEHFKDIFEIDFDTLKGAYSLSKKIAEAVKAACNADGINILQNNGTAAGQSVDHFHIHVIPRISGDSSRVHIYSEAAKISDSCLDEIRNSIYKELTLL